MLNYKIPIERIVNDLRAICKGHKLVRSLHEQKISPINQLMMISTSKSQLVTMIASIGCGHES